jgi:nucleotide-binding universal stress UspA family protein
VIRRILVALDGSPRAPGVMAAAIEIGKRFGATLIPFRAIQIPPEVPPAAHVPQSDPLAQHMEHAAIDEILPLLEGLDVVWEVPVIGHGQPWRAILAAAEEENVDLIVLGSHGYHGLDRVLGTTAGKVANLARRSVLIVHNRLDPPNSDALLSSGDEEVP